jgi:FdhD protein
MTRSILTAPVRRVEGEGSSAAQDLLAVEEPLEIRLSGRTVAITMRTPGNDFELAVGFLFTEGIVDGARRIESVRHVSTEGHGRQAGNVVAVELKAGVEIDFERLERHFYMTSSCGVCGKASIDALYAQGCPMIPRNTAMVRSETVHGLPDALREAQAVFDRTGGLHAAALFDASGKLLGLREDVGRHNAVDKLIGAEVLAGTPPLHDRLILVSGRASFELIQKTLMAGIPILAAVGAPSSLAVETARRFGMTLLGFVRNRRFNIYSGEWRIQ